MITRNGDTGKISPSTNLGNRTSCSERSMVRSIKQYDIFHTQVADFRPHQHLLAKSYKCIKATIKRPVSGTQMRVWWAGLVSPQPNNDSSLVYVWVRWLQYEDRSTRLLRKTLSKLWHLLDRQSSIDFRPSLMTSIWWLLRSLQTPFHVTGLPTVNAFPSTSLCILTRSGNYAWSFLPLILSYQRLFGFLHLLFCNITGYGILGWYLQRSLAHLCTFRPWGDYLLDNDDFDVAHYLSLIILPSISVARCRSPASHLFPSSTSTTIV